MVVVSGVDGHHAATMYSLIGSAEFNGLDAKAYLRTVLSQFDKHPVNRVAELLPWNPGGAVPVAADKIVAIPA